MNNSMQPGGFSDRRDNYARLASWLQQIMKQPPTTIKPMSTGENDILLELLLDSDYHLHFYQQLPDFIIALLADEEQAYLAALRRRLDLGEDSIYAIERDTTVTTVRNGPERGSS